VARVVPASRAKGNLERDIRTNPVALRGIRGKDFGETAEVQKYMLGLALIAATADRELSLRKGCLLRYAHF
jgi:CRISPR-associated protein Csb1